MNYLYRYIRSFLPDALPVPPGMALSTRERETLAALAPAENAESKTAVMKQLGMSASMFDKTCSVLLRRFLEYAAPGGGIALLAHLQEQGLMDLLLHELRRMESDMRRERSSTKRAEFYREVFRIIHLKFNSDYPEHVAKRIATTLRRLDPTRDTAISVQAQLLAMRVWIFASKRDSDREIVERALRANDKRIVATTGSRARFDQLTAWITYYGQLKRDTERRRALLHQMEMLCEKRPDVFSVREHVQVLCRIAEDHYFYSADHATPLKLYRELYARFPEIVPLEKYHLLKMTQLCLITGDLELARQILTTHFGSAADLIVQRGGVSKSVALLWAKLNFLAGDFAEARRHLDDAIALNQKGFYLQFEIECRMIQTALIYAEGDHELAEKRIATHIKFLKTKGITYKTSRFYPWFFRLIGAIIDERTAGKPFTPRLEAKLAEYMEGAAAQYGVVLKKLRASQRFVAAPSRR